MHKKISLLADDPCPELLCGLCLDILEEPIQVHCPEDHMFCSQCIHRHTAQQETCPLCFTPLDKTSFQLSKFVSRQISRLRVRCLYKEHGCEWQGLYSDRHSDQCEYKPCVCPNAENGCIESLTEKSLQEHVHQCPYQIMSCPSNIPLCQPFLRKDQAVHEDTCASYICSYATEGCPFVGTLTQVNMHCEQYCGRLHKKIDELEEENKRLNKLISDYSMLSVKLPSTPETHLPEVESEPVKDEPLDELGLLQQMFSGDPFSTLALSSPSTTTLTPSTLESSSKQQDLMDFSFIPDLHFFDPSSSHFNLMAASPGSPDAIQFIPPVSAPKRTSNGKKIRYSKNVRLAHNALRMARQRSAIDSNPSNDAILNNLSLAKQKTEEVKKEKNTKPMFILASSYLSQYQNDSSNEKI
ncbi:hypothetical protein BDB01DRAFT_805880 [Pilobolus umbonatus]|nr:hypothetical protein BDB01DRAFT_805880 [Pilobolus umbonatus]